MWFQVFLEHLRGSWQTSHQLLHLCGKNLYRSAFVYVAAVSSGTDMEQTGHGVS